MAKEFQKEASKFLNSEKHYSMSYMDRKLREAKKKAVAKKMTTEEAQRRGRKGGRPKGEQEWSPGMGNWRKVHRLDRF